MKIQFHTPGITVFESALYRTTATIVEWNGAILITDPNWLPIEIGSIKNHIQNYYPDRSRFLYFTHADFDHILGYGAFSGATTIGDHKMARLGNKQSIIDQITEFDNRYYIHRPYPVSFPEIDVQIDHDGFHLGENDEQIIFFLTPGHVDNGSAVIIPKFNLCIAGDYLSNIEIPWIEYDFSAYLNTLELFQQYIAKYNIKYLVTGHGDIATGGPEIHKRIQEDKAYIHAFLHDFAPDNPLFEKVISSKGNEDQNRIIHQKNLSFFKCLM